MSKDINDEINDLVKLGKKFSLVLADPPWTFTTYSAKGGAKSPSKHYKTMTLEDIKKIPVASIMEDNSLCFMWVYQPLLPQAIEVMNAWGFEYKSIGFVWRKLTKNGKPHMSTGYYTRAGMEMCIIGRRGKKSLERHNKGMKQVFESVVREHSRKPDEVYDMLDSMYHCEKVELFSRNTTRPSWTFLGNEKGKF